MKYRKWSNDENKIERDEELCAGCKIYHKNSDECCYKYVQADKCEKEKRLDNDIEDSHDELEM